MIKCQATASQAVSLRLCIFGLYSAIQMLLLLLLGDPLCDGGGHVQGLEDCNTSLSQPPHEDPRLCVESSIIWHSSAGSTFQENNSAACGFYHSASTVCNSLPRKPITDSF